ncbi:hypothetical protein BT96DRAFT_1019390 [Gymnopus androsaceus JB14]|uniref:PARP catalytic domain-containing protein n=1 Tax=Gymnopus androsaceus JB14 TaxID=1447944 RepID=A0A6A4HNE3_9AGAR|nr:hypothetical protein BT96DRAFT_1019390 [Gymnopus androsaceus JB14]
MTQFPSEPDSSSTLITAIDGFSLNHPENHHRKRYARILPLESSDPKFAQVEKLFLKGWRHPNKPKHEIRAVFKILSSDESLELYTNYKSQVQAFNLLSRFKKGANEQLERTFVSKDSVPESTRRLVHPRHDGYGSKYVSRNTTRVLLLNRVVVGRPHNRRHNATYVNQPPAGYHSARLPGVDLNYEETVVYRNDAIRPAYLVVYGPQL